MKKIIVLLLGAALLLAACQGQAAPSPAPPEAAPTGTSAPTLTVAATSAYPTSAAPPGCTVVSPQPTPGPTEESLFPPITEADWIQGSPDARITLTEYSDFQ